MAPSEAPAPDGTAELPASASAKKAPKSFRSRNHEFLAATLEVLETPHSPIAAPFAIFIGMIFLSAIAWSYFGWLDIHAVAQGVIRPSGRSKTVQPVERGRVVSIRAENGSAVNAGDVLFELDPTETLADLEVKAQELESSKAEVARRRAEIAAARTAEFQIIPIKFEPGTASKVRRREEDVLAAELAQLAASKASLEAQLNESLATKERLASSINSRANLIALGMERIELRGGWKVGGFGSRALVIDAQQQLQTQITTDAGDRGQLIETDAAISTLKRKIDETVAKFIADQNQKLSDAERKQSQLVKELIDTQVKSEHTRITAPISGTVQQLSVTTVGQVVASGQSLMTIVPLDAPIEIEAKMENKDIGFIELGQTAAVKIDAFPFTHYGTIDGTVMKVSSDAIDTRDPMNPSGPANVGNNNQGTNATPRSPTEYLAFPIIIALAQRSINVDGKDVPLSPGMGATVEIKTGQRRAIDYLLSPLREIASNAAHER